MLKYAALRLLQAPAVLLVLAVLSFALMRMAPGGPFSKESKAGPEVAAALDAKYGRDAAPPVQFARWLGRSLTGDFGPSMKQRSQDVDEIIGRTLPTSLVLGGVALLVALGLGVAAGVIAAAKRATLVDHAAMTIAMLGLSVPSFVVGPLLALVFALWLGLLPPAGWHGLSQPAYLVLPAITLGLPFAARIARLTRAGMLEVLTQDFIRTARAKGLSDSAVLLRHGLRGGITPVISYLGPAVAYLLTGSLVVEQVFQIPGLGREFVEAALNRDEFLVMGTVLVYGAILIVANLAADLVLAVIDPRVRYA
ncbi:MAG TPA: ABC transporter permease [Planctomycetota bacterium]|nr:ABC transporter permease [Planctomycetota bacterium]